MGIFGQLIPILTDSMRRTFCSCSQIFLHTLKAKFSISNVMIMNRLHWDEHVRKASRSNPYSRAANGRNLAGLRGLSCSSISIRQYCSLLIAEHHVDRGFPGLLHRLFREQSCRPPELPYTAFFVVYFSVCYDNYSILYSNILTELQ